MRYKIKNTNTVFQRHEFAAHFPNTSVPTSPSPADLLFLNLEEVPDPEPTAEEAEETKAKDLARQLLQTREQAKAQRAMRVAAIKVTTKAGNTFDGDESSIAAILQQVAVATPVQGVAWVLADNTTIITTREELLEALTLAITERANLWPL